MKSKLVSRCRLKSTFGLLLVAILLLGGCAHHAAAPVAEVDVEHLMTQWPEALQAIQQVNRIHNPSERAVRMARFQSELAENIRRASGVVAARDGLALVVTRDLVGYGNRDITPEVIAELHHRRAKGNP